MEEVPGNGSTLLAQEAAMARLVDVPAGVCVCDTSDTLGVYLRHLLADLLPNISVGHLDGTGVGPWSETHGSALSRARAIARSANIVALAVGLTSSDGATCDSTPHGTVPDGATMLYDVHTPPSPTSALDRSFGVLELALATGSGMQAVVAMPVPTHGRAPFAPEELPEEAWTEALSDLVHRILPVIQVVREMNACLVST